jgi:hypothetical protein
LESAASEVEGTYNKERAFYRDAEAAVADAFSCT